VVCFVYVRWKWPCAHCCATAQTAQHSRTSSDVLMVFAGSVPLVLSINYSHITITHIHTPTGLNLPGCGLDGNLSKRSFSDGYSNTLSNVNMKWNRLNGQVSVCSHVCECVCATCVYICMLGVLTLPCPQLPDELGALVNLEVLNLAGNILEGPLHPSLFRDLVHLKECILCDNSFTGQIPDCFKDMKTLKVLDLSRNNFIGMHYNMYMYV